MGVTCSHYDYEITNIDENTIDDIDDIWIYKTADGKCKECNDVIRLSKRTCKDHNITQPWEIVDIHSCKHERIYVRNKRKSPKESKIYGTGICAICLLDCPVYASYHQKYYKDELMESRTSEWKIDSDKK